MQELNPGLELQLGVPGMPLNINKFLTAMRTQYDLGYLDDVILGRAFMDMIYNFSQRVLPY